MRGKDLKKAYDNDFSLTVAVEIENFLNDYFSAVDCGQTFIKRDFKTYSAMVNGKIYGS